MVEVRKKEEGRRKKEEGRRKKEEGRRIKNWKKGKKNRYNYLKSTKSTILSISEREALFIAFFFHAWYN